MNIKRAIISHQPLISIQCLWTPTSGPRQWLLMALSILLLFLLFSSLFIILFILFCIFMFYYFLILKKDMQCSLPSIVRKLSLHLSFSLLFQPFFLTKTNKQKRIRPMANQGGRLHIRNPKLAIFGRTRGPGAGLPHLV